MQSRPIRTAIVGAVHDHFWPVFGPRGYFDDVKDLSEDFDVVAAADIDARREADIKNMFGLDHLYDTVEDLLDGETFDAALLSLPNARKADVFEALMVRGIHVLMDKPMAATLDQAQRMYQAYSKANGVVVMENSPSAWRPAMVESLRLLGDGAIGDIYWLKVRTANPGARAHGATESFLDWLHDPALNGGGALIDYSYYGIKLATLLFGAPETVWATTARYVDNPDIPAELEDNSLVVMTFPSATAVVEGSWSQFGANVDMEIDPSNSALTAYGSSGTLRAAHRRGYIDLVNSENVSGTRIEVSAPSEGAPANGPAYFARCIREEVEPVGMTSPTDAFLTQRVIDAAYRSAASGQPARLV